MQVSPSLGLAVGFLQPADILPVRASKASSLKSHFLCCFSVRKVTWPKTAS